MHRRKGTRVLGPYRDKERGDWRVVIIDDGEEGSARSAQRCATEAEAHALVAKLEEELKLEGPITVEEALKEYEEYKRAKGNKPGTIATTMRRVRGLVGAPERRLVETGRGASETYAAYADGKGRRDKASRSDSVHDGRDPRRRAVDTHRNALGEARTFGEWCVRKGYLRHNPWAEVEGVGARSAGKEQLRIDEARAFMAKAFELAGRGDDGALAAICALVMGYGASEIVERVGRDVDDGGAVFWIPKGKTKNRVRVMEVPLLPPPFPAEWMRDTLWAQAVIVGPTGWLFPAETSKLGHRRREWVRDETIRICKLAGVPIVCAHALRGTNATIGAANGVVPQVVANSLGNTEAVAKGHYIQPGAAGEGRNRRALQVLAGGKR